MASPNPKPSCVAALPEPLEWLEYPVLLLLVYSCAGIVHCQYEIAIRISGNQFDSTFLCELQRIGQQVAADAEYQAAVAYDNLIRLINRFKCQPLLFHLWHELRFQCVRYAF